MMRVVEGQYSDGHISSVYPARLRIEGAGRLSVESLDRREIFLGTVSPAGYRIEPRLGSAPRRITFLDGASFATDNHTAIDELHHRIGGAGWQRWVPWLEGSLSLALVAAAVAALVVWYMITAGIPAIAKAVAYTLPVESQQQIGRGTLELLDRHYFEPSSLDPVVIARMEKTFAPVLDNYPDIGPRLAFRDGHMGPNAFALPSGLIIFTDDLVQLAENDEQLLAVLYHELGHLYYRHLLRRSLQGSILTVVAIFVTGDVSGINEIIASLPALVIDASYSRNFEREADEYALRQMTRSGVSIQALAAILERMDSQRLYGQSRPGFLSSHPGTRERIDAIGQFESSD